MAATTVFLTAAIAVVAVADICLAFPLSTLSKREKREKFGFRLTSGKRATLTRWACLACFISLAVALFLAHEELSGGTGKRGVMAGNSSFCLALLLAFNIAVNVVAAYLPFHSQRACSSSRSNSLLPITDPHCRSCARQTFKSKDNSALSFQHGSGGITTVQADQLRNKNGGDHHGTTMCINLEAACGKSAEASLASRYLDRRDSDLMISGPAPLRKLRLGLQDSVIPEAQPYSKIPQEEALLDALMLDTVSVLVDC